MRSDFDLAIIGSGFGAALLAMIARRIGLFFSTGPPLPLLGIERLGAFSKKNGAASNIEFHA